MSKLNPFLSSTALNSSAFRFLFRRRVPVGPQETEISFLIMYCWASADKARHAAARMSIVFFIFFSIKKGPLKSFSFLNVCFKRSADNLFYQVSSLLQRDRRVYFQP